jgi:hypothetical protein
VGRTGGSRGGHQSAGLSAPTDHPHYLQLVAFTQRDGRKRRTFEDLAVVLHRHRARVDPQLLDVIEELSRLLQLDTLAVDLQRDHSNILIAA